MTKTLGHFYSNNFNLFILASISTLASAADELARQIALNNWQLPKQPQQQQNTVTLNGQTYLLPTIPQQPASIYQPQAQAQPAVYQPQPQAQPPALTAQQQQALLSAYANAQNAQPQLYSYNGQTFIAPPTYTSDAILNTQAAAPIVGNEQFQQAPMFLKSQDDYMEEAYAPQQIPPSGTRAPQSAPQFIRTQPSGTTLAPSEASPVSNAFSEDAIAANLAIEVRKRNSDTCIGVEEKYSSLLYF